MEASRVISDLYAHFIFLSLTLSVTSCLTGKTFRLYYKEQSVNIMYVGEKPLVLMARVIKNTNTQCGENTVLFHVQPDGTCSNR